MTGKEKLFETIREEFQDKIYRLCCYYFHHEEDRKDLLHDIYIRIWNGLDSFEQRSSISTWIFRISVNSCIDFLRKEKKRKRIRSDACLEEQKIVDSSENIEKDFIISEKVKCLYDCIDRLSLLEKTLISLYLEDLSYREIADIVGITEQNVGVKIFRIKKNLNSYLEEY